MILPLAIAAVIGYLLGSLPFGYLVARSRGVNIFEVGSRNPGATNVRRVLGSGPGNLVLALDALKGAVAAGWALLAFTQVVVAYDFNLWGIAFAQRFAGDGWIPLGVAGLVGALAGHGFSCFTGFKGGKGVATGAGGFLVLFPLGIAIALVVWGLTAGLTRYASLASMLGALTLPVAAWLLNASLLILAVSGVVAVFVVWRHRANISRLLHGTESKMGARSAATKS